MHRPFCQSRLEAFHANKDGCDIVYPASRRGTAEDDYNNFRVAAIGMGLYTDNAPGYPTSVNKLVEDNGSAR